MDGSRLRRSVPKILLLGWISFGMVGCIEFRDKISSRRFREKPIDTLFVTPDPMETLRTVEEGDDRIRAMRNLKEPKKNGLSDEDQNEILQILAATATSDKSGLCRLTAIETLSRFEDPRIPEILVSAYHNSTGETEKPGAEGVVQTGLRSRLYGQASSSFTPETITLIRCRSIEAMGKSRSPGGLKLLCEIASKPVKRREINADELGIPVEDVVNHFDVRLAALRALANYQGESEAIRVLFQVMQTEKDVALKNRAYEGLVSVTGQKLPPDPVAWQNWLGQPRTNNP
jgi:hypothetical protein